MSETTETQEKHAAAAFFDDLRKKLQSRFTIDLQSTPDLLYVGVLATSMLPEIESLLAEVVGLPYKPRGQTAILKNFFDAFVKRVGGIRRSQSLYRREFDGEVSVYVALWPWESKPERVSLRIGFLYPSDAVRATLLQQVTPPKRAR